jgi:D-xylose transport system substrate-binding protein
VNSTTKDESTGQDVKSVYVPPTWVTVDNMASTVVKDAAITVSDLCTGALQSACQAAGIQ